MREACPCGGDGSLLTGFGNQVASERLAEKVIERKVRVGDFVVEPAKVGSKGAFGGRGVGAREEQQASLEVCGEAFLLKHALD